MKIKYKDWNPSIASTRMVAKANVIIAEYEAEGYTLTLRQLYYQFVARDIIENSVRSYKNLGTTITKARLAGMISWEAIEDRNRTHNSFWFEENVLNPIKSLPYSITFDRWERQDTYVEVWVEKEALGNVVERACDPLYVPHMSCKGYLSSSEAWRAGRRYKEKLDAGYNCVLIHLGDHDPSGIDMTRDNKDRLDLFTEEWIEGVAVTRLALNMDQVEEYTPPPNPAKVTDSRAKDYIRKFGPTAWELDALEPSVLEELITSTVSEYIDWDIWDETKAEQELKRDVLRGLSIHWDKIEPILMEAL